MGKEIERKFLVKNNSWKKVKGVDYKQGYLSRNKERTVRVRVANKKGYLTFKGINIGATRTEYEYEIPYKEALRLLNEVCGKPLIEKKRYLSIQHRIYLMILRL